MFQSAWNSFCISFVTGSPGSGKSYTLVKDLHARLGEFRGKVITNLPIDVDAFADSVAAEYGRDAEEVKDQLLLIPAEVLSHWRDGRATPGELASYPERIGLTSVVGALFILDEVHLFCPKRDRNRQGMWEKWLGEVRHEGWAGLFFVSQDERKVGQAIQEHAELRFELTKADRNVYPVLGLELYYIWELVASFTGKYWACIQVRQFGRGEGKLRLGEETTVRLDPKYFSLYRSLEAAGGGTGEGALTSKQLEYERRPTWWFREDEDGKRLAPVWFWVLSRNLRPLGLRVGIVAIGLWLTVGGGAIGIYTSFMRGLMGGVSKQMAGARSPAEEPSADQALIGDVQSTGVRNLEQIEPQPIEAFTEEGAKRLAAVLGKLDAPEREEVLRHVQAMRQAFEAERQSLRVAEYEEHLRKQKLKEAVKIVAMDRDRVWLSDGTELFQGEEVHGGVFDGLHVAEINRGRRFVRFNDDYVVSMSQPNGMRDSESVPDGESDPQPSPGANRSGATGVSGPLRNGPSGGSTEGN